MRPVLPPCTKFMMGEKKALMEPVTDEDIIAEERERFNTGTNAAGSGESEEETAMKFKAEMRNAFKRLV